MDANSRIRLQNLLSICTSVPNSEGKELPLIEGFLIVQFIIDSELKKRASNKNTIYSSELIREKVNQYNLFNIQ
jgi:hypothetical protein